MGRVQQQMVLREDEIAVLMLRGTAHSENFVADCQAAVSQPGAFGSCFGGSTF